MRAQLAAAKAGSADIEARLRSLTSRTRQTKARSAIQTHQRDWYRTHAELQRQRSEAEGARALWLQAEGDASTAEGGLASLHELVRDDEAASAARREWSIELRSQLLGLRELCAASSGAAERAPATQLVSELSRSLASQGARLASAAEALERDLHESALSLFAPEEEPSGTAESGAGSLADPLGLGDFFGGGGGAAAAGAAAGEEGGEGAPGCEEAERRLLEDLGCGLRAEEEAHREALHLLRLEYFGADAHGGAGAHCDGGEDDEGGGADSRPNSGGSAAHGASGAAYGGGSAGGGGAALPADSGGLAVAGDYFVLEAEGEAEGGPTCTSGGGIASACAAYASSVAGTSPAGGASPAAASPASPTSRPGTGGGGRAGAAWGEADRGRLAKLEREFRGRSRAALLSRLRLELPHIPPNVIEAQLERLGRRRAYASRRRAMVLQWESRKAALASSARQLLHEHRVSAGKMLLRREEREALAARRRELHATLEVLERAKARREAEAAAEARAAAEVAAALVEAQRAKAEAERAHKKALIARYQEEQQECARLEAVKALEAEADAQAARLERAEHNLRRVQFRIELEERKRAARAEQREHERLIGEAHALQMQRFREHAIAQLGVESDPARATGPTAASSAPPVSHEELFPVTGYADETLMKDMRFKLGHALRNAGLNGTDYARQLLTSSRFGGPTRPDTISNIPFFSGE